LHNTVGYTQWTFDLTDSLALTAGVRYTDDQKDSYPDQFDYSTPNVKQVPVQWYEGSYSATTPSASISWHPTDSAMLYFSYAEGFKGGGWNSHFNAVLTVAQEAALHEFQPESAQTFELGAKLDLLDDTLRLNAAIFTSDYTDMQITYRGPAPAGVAPFLFNAGKSSIDGAELEAIWAPVAGLQLEGSVGYLDASIDRLDTDPLLLLPPGLQEGNALPFAPEWQMHLGAAYTFNAGSMEFTPRLDASYQSETFFDATNTSEIAQLGGYTILNASVSLRPGKPLARGGGS
jgi:iron complex outermembrane receptor protein